MNRRLLISGFLVVLCLATLWGIWGQRSQLAGLRADQQQLLAQLATRAGGSASPGTGEVIGASSETPQPALVATLELLRLRNEVTQLSERRHELDRVRTENEKLRTQLASRGTNGQAGIQLPPAYLRKSEARMVGYRTPDDTIQSLLWALRSRDLTNLLQVFTPEMAEELRDQIRQSKRPVEDFFRGTEAVPGMAIFSRKQLADGSLELAVEIVPGLPSAPISMRQVGGEWKIDKGF